MAASLSTIGAVNKAPVGASVPPTAFYGKSLKKVSFRTGSPKNLSWQVRALSDPPAQPEIDEKKQTNTDRWRGLVEDISDDQQDITRGKGMTDTLFQAPTGCGTHDAVLSSYEYLSQGLRQ